MLSLVLWITLVLYITGMPPVVGELSIEYKASAQEGQANIGWQCLLCAKQTMEQGCDRSLEELARNTVQVRCFGLRLL